MHLSFFQTGLNVSAYFWEIRVVRVMEAVWSSTESLSMTFTDRQRDSGCLMHCSRVTYDSVHYLCSKVVVKHRQEPYSETLKHHLSGGICLYYLCVRCFTTQRWVRYSSPNTSDFLKILQVYQSWILNRAKALSKAREEMCSGSAGQLRFQPETHTFIWDVHC